MFYTTWFLHIYIPKAGSTTMVVAQKTSKAKYHRNLSVPNTGLRKNFLRLYLWSSRLPSTGNFWNVVRTDKAISDKTKESIGTEWPTNYWNIQVYLIQRWKVLHSSQDINQITKNVVYLVLKKWHSIWLLIVSLWIIIEIQDEHFDIKDIILSDRIVFVDLW